jgi:hypothetical protein
MLIDPGWKIEKLEGWNILGDPLARRKSFQPFNLQISYFQ